MKAKLVLEDGLAFTGESFGASGESCGEVVFNTSLTGYQEILTDPSYKGQIVTMTYPLIGNYGVNDEDVESFQPFLEGFVVREYSQIASNWRAQKSLSAYLKEKGVMAIEGVDTRALTRHIRVKGAMRGVISTEDLDERRLREKARSFPALMGRDLVREVTCAQAYTWSSSREGETRGRWRVVVLDCGVKFNILRELVKQGCEVRVVPASTSAQDILAMKPDGLLLSNGPGDPAGVPYVINTVKQMLGRLPIMGICLGHQILALSLGGRTYKLKFGHHGANHPVKDLNTDKIEITVQNHGFCVDIDSLNRKEIRITHINLNDQTLEGMEHRYLPIFSVQFHPEASPGPHDAKHLFRRFLKMIEEYAQAHRHS
ncbi:MAG: carbamoyl phosphate synthase small subunit [Candidatus Omnitrophota bacterium]|nr:MAG: carbamoyl phosphate synthase small subunit [Candidatus Omnitrophota bacterium]